MDTKQEPPNFNSTTIGSILHLLKACLGSGILAMPAAFKNAGIIPGSIGTILAGFICTHTVHMLVKTSQEVCVDAKVPSMSFAETCGAAFTHGPKRLRPWGNFMKQLVDYSVSLTYISVLCVYVVFIGSSFKEVFDVILPDLNLSIQTYCVLTLVPLVLLVQIRNLKYLVPFSAFANALIVVVFGITMYYMFSDLPPLIENEMAKPQKFLSCIGVLNTAMFIVISLYAVIAQIAKLVMAVVIYFSYALQCYVPMEVITRLLKKRQSDKFENIIQVSIRTLLVIVSVGIATAFPNLELVIGFVGAIFFSTLGLLIPAIVETAYRWDRDTGKFNYIIYKNIFIALISLFAMFSGAYVSVVGIIDEFFVGNHNVDNSTLLDVE
ncbi:hypothetical protein MSG28_001381 [Choristoneura fumiferana]|uniref:Uncharacterized protein n=1 Tax=Choristoneura fumiferana TaxID=7141 RepID=A0ACC0KUD9_CHOFU|nr:hypothetical protein MSG28_001381 [Choristoneura fumiferana]